jgi:sodium-coupled neutral amino acid transporter 11
VQRFPLLTGVEAPSVTVADEYFNPEDHLESARPRSNMSSAFMNMANSIMSVHVFQSILNSQISNLCTRL